jgi:hypothetical protein
MEEYPLYSTGLDTCAMDGLAATHNIAKTEMIILNLQ